MSVIGTGRLCRIKAKAIYSAYGILVYDKVSSSNIVVYWINSPDLQVRAKILS